MKILGGGPGSGRRPGAGMVDRALGKLPSDLRRMGGKLPSLGKLPSMGGNPLGKLPKDLRNIK